MKKLDRYIAWNFIVGYFIAFCVMMGLTIIIDLFVNLDEFAEHSELGTWGIIISIFRFYALQSTIYFRDFAGMIAVVAAAFSLGRLIRNNELIAVMASGVSLKRILMPVLVLALLLTGILVIDQEFLIPPFADQLVRSQDTLPGEATYDVWFMKDVRDSLICTPNFRTDTATMENPIIFLREAVDENYSRVTGYIRAEEAIYNYEAGLWELNQGVYIRKSADIETAGLEGSPIGTYKTDLVPKDIPVLRKNEHLSLLSSAQLSQLVERGKTKDLPALYSQKHFRITDPIINLVMLMISLPILVCREPKAMKTAVMLSFIVTSSCYVLTFISRMMATEAQFLRPELWAWLPIFVFLPIAFIELDAMKT